MSKMTKLINYRFEIFADKQFTVDILTRKFVEDHTSIIVNRIADHKMHCNEKGIEFTETDSLALFFKCLNSMVDQVRLNYEIVYDNIYESIKNMLESNRASSIVCDTLQDRFAGVDILDITQNSIKFSIDTDYVDEPEEVMLFLDSTFNDFQHIAKDLVKDIDLELIDFVKDTELVYEDYLDIEKLDSFFYIKLHRTIKDIDE